jgi:L-ribulokinase
MSSGFDSTYYPREEQAAIYQSLYQKYLQAGAFVENRFLPDAESVPAGSFSDTY